MNKILIGSIGGLIVAVAAGSLFVINYQPKAITNYDECAAAGYPILKSYPEQCRTPDGKIFVKEVTTPPPPPSESRAEFGSRLVFSVGEQMRFNDGLVVVLAEINDSRCKPDVQCIWAGELSPSFILVGGSVGNSIKEVRLGVTTKKQATESNYIIILNEATESTATVTVTKKTASAPPPPPISAVTFEGTIECLPKKGPGPHTAECAIGLKGKNGAYYALRDLSKYDPNHQYSVTGAKVIVTGKLTNEASNYDVAGIITVTSIKRSPTSSAPPVPPASGGVQVFLKEGDRRGPLLVEKIFPTYITGQVFREYPIATDQGSPITMNIGDSASNGCTITLTLMRIQNGVATFTEKTDYTRPCPICLVENTLIDTPSGQIKIQNLRTGMEVWTKDISGAKVSVKIVETGKVKTPSTHEAMRVILHDGRELLASPGHPTADGRFIGNLRAGQVLDGSIIKSIEAIKYGDQYTYDILPVGETGFYWANGILMGSTLNK